MEAQSPAVGIHHQDMSGLAFAQIPNSLLREYPGLSLGARGLWALMCSHQDGWKFWPEAVAKQMGTNAKAVRRYLRELESFGLLQRQSVKGASGRYSGYSYTLIRPSRAAAKRLATHSSSGIVPSTPDLGSDRKADSCNAVNGITDDVSPVDGVSGFGQYKNPTPKKNKEREKTKPKNEWADLHREGLNVKQPGSLEQEAPGDTLLRLATAGDKELVDRLVRANGRGDSWHSWFEQVLFLLDQKDRAWRLIDPLEYVEKALDPKQRDLKDIGELEQPGKYLVKKILEVCKANQVHWPPFPADSPVVLQAPVFRPPEPARHEHSDLIEKLAFEKSLERFEIARRKEERDRERQYREDNLY